MDLTGALQDPEMMATANNKAQDLLEELKKSVKADIKEIGTLRKEVTITVPAKAIADHVEHNFSELQSDAVVPGFRKGHAPRALIEKRFGGDVRQSLKTTIIGQSYFAVLENNEIEALGDPLFRIEGEDDNVKLVDIGEAMNSLQLPDSGDFTYVCEMEIKPTFELPELKGIDVEVPTVEITDEQVDEKIERYQKIRGRYEPLPDSAAEEGDVLICDVKLTVDGKEVKTEENVHVGVRDARLDGISVTGLTDILKGTKVGDTKTADCEVPDDYERADLRGKKGQFEFKINELKRLKQAEISAVVEQFGAESEEQLKEMIREDLEAEKAEMTRTERRKQVQEYLLENTSLDLPEQLSARQTDRAVVREVIQLRQQGVPEDEVDAKIDELRTTAKEQVARDLKLEFILDKVADTLDVHVTDEEVNTQIAMMARMYGQRFDRIRDQLASQGLLEQMAGQILHSKCIDQILEDAKVVEVKND